MLYENGWWCMCMLTSANDSTVICVGAEPQGALIDSLTVSNATFLASTVESIQINGSCSNSIFLCCDCESFAGVFIADLSADHLSITVSPEDILADGAPCPSNAKLHPAFKAITAITQSDITIYTG